uniref:(California timema) hypothetical protein n=1 Tax=Timema californicum TaxID=61474 RepID=A0A7R9JKQ5_TIMCA|nr:unnamed protein product [Timema californicum]
MDVSNHGSVDLSLGFLPSVTGLYGFKKTHQRVYYAENIKLVWLAMLTSSEGVRMVVTCGKKQDFVLHTQRSSRLCALNSVRTVLRHISLTPVKI